MYDQDRGRFTHALSENAARKLHAISKRKSFVNLLLLYEHQQFKNSFSKHKRNVCVTAKNTLRFYYPLKLNHTQYHQFHLSIARVAQR